MNTCTCGHSIEEHENNFMQSCTVEGCFCIAYEEAEQDDEDGA